MKRFFPALVWLFSLSFALGCNKNPAVKSTLDTMWQWDGGVEASRVFERIGAAKAPPDVPAAVGVTGRGLVGRALPDGKLWTYEGEVDVLPTLVGDAVFFSGGGEVLMLDVKTGAVRYRLSTKGRRLEGAGYDGTHSILLLVDSDDAREDQILALGPRGEPGLNVTATSRLGTPGAIAGVGLIPYSGQYVGAVDLESGKHIGRILLRDGLHRMKAENGQMTAYGAGATAFVSKLSSEPDSPSLKLLEKQFPGEPSWPVDGSKPRPPRAAPVALYAEPIVSEGTAKFAQGTYVTTYYEVALGLSHGKNRLRWVTHFDRTIVGGDSSPTGVTLCLEDGRVVRLALHDGTASPFGALEARLKACVVTASPDALSEGKREPLLAQVVSTISGTGPDMVAIKKVLLEQIKNPKSEEVTAALLQIAQDPMISSEIARRAGKLLTSQKAGGELMLKALRDDTEAQIPAADAPTPAPAPGEQKPKPEESKPDEGAPPEASPSPNGGPAPERRKSLRPPPVGFIAQALLKLKTPGAAAALALYLNDPSQNAKDIKLIMTAVVELGGAEEVTEVREFVESYKNTGGEPQLLDALAMGVHFLLKHLPEEDQKALIATLSQSLTHPDLAKRLKDVLNPSSAHPAVKK